MDVQWYPGHMTKAVRQMQEDIRLVDLVIELTDARVPLSGRNPDIDRLAAGKGRVLLLNKADLADEEGSLAWKRYFEERGIWTGLLDSRDRQAARRVMPLIQEAGREKRERDRRRGIVNRPLRVMIVGIPNVGKSTFINSFAGRASARTGNKPGVTKGKQWIRPGKDVELLDTPGILWPKFEDQQVGRKLAVIGSIREELLDQRELACWAIDYLMRRYPETLRERYGVSGEERAPEVLEQIAQARGCLVKSGARDIDRASGLLLEDLRGGRLGKISLEFPDTTR